MLAVVFVLAVAFFLPSLKEKKKKTGNSWCFDLPQVKSLLSKGWIKGRHMELQYLGSLII